MTNEELLQKMEEDMKMRNFSKCQKGRSILTPLGRTFGDILKNNKKEKNVNIAQGKLTLPNKKDLKYKVLSLLLYNLYKNFYGKNLQKAFDKK